MRQMILSNVHIATMTGPDPYGLIRQGCLVLKKGFIDWVGAAEDLPSHYAPMETHDLDGRLVTPGLIDCHTHIVHGGNRAKEFEQRLSGVSYAQIAEQGGGILSTVSATRASSVEELVESALPRVDALLSEGVMTLEIKSGYGLTADTELNMLHAARQIAARRPVRVATSYLAAHAVPPEFEGRPRDYISRVCIPTLETATQKGLVDAVDGFCETIAFSVEDLAPLYERAKALGLPVKLHAEQLSHQGGCRFATDHSALSVDHIEHSTETDVEAMANSGTAAVLLPGAFYTLRERQMPPIAALRRYGVPMALATDCNPGSSPLTSLLLTMNMGCTLFGMTPGEALAAVTCHAARALGRQDVGQIAPGKRADLCIWDADHPAELSYRIGFNPLHRRVFDGVMP